MTGEILIICLLGGIIAADTTAAFQILVSHPLVACSIAGLLLGDVNLGLTIGILFELPWLYEIPVGGVRFCEGNVGSMVAAALAVIWSRQFSMPNAVLFVSIVWGIIVAYFGGTLVVLYRHFNTRLIHKADQAAERGSCAGVSFNHMQGVLFSMVLGIIVTIAALCVGLELITPLFEALPANADSYFTFTKPLFIGIGLGVMAVLFINRKTKNAIAAGIAVGVLLVILL